MSSISSSIYGSSVSKGVGGLLSGLDTDELVEQMTATTRNKINRQYQAKQKLLYKQEAYREISSKLLSFSNKYLSYSTGSKTNILSSSFFESYTYKSSSDYVNVTGNTDNIKNFSINSITSVASAASLYSNKKVTSEIFSSSDIKDKVSTLAGETFTVNYEGKDYKVTIDKEFSGETLADVVNQLNVQLGELKDSEDNPLNISFGLNGDKFELSDGYISAGSTRFLETLNLGTGEENGKISSEAVLEADLVREKSEVLSDTSSYITFEYNGIAKTINLAEKVEVPKEGGGTEEITLDDENALTRYLQNELDKAYGKDRLSVELNGSALSFSAIGDTKDTDVFGIKSISKDLSRLTGLKSGAGNRVNLYATLEESGIEGLNTPVGEDGKYSITINGTTLEFEKTAALNDVIKAINNNSDMKVNITYLNTTDTFSVIADETGSHIGIDIQDDGEGSLAYALFGSDRNVTEGNDTKMSYTLNGVDVEVTRSTANFTVDGINVELSSKAQGAATSEQPITFDVTNNTDEIVEKVKGFIDEYNEIIELIGTQTSEKPDRDYQPLTPEQQDDMSEDEINNWTEEAKKGILFGDSKINSLLRNMREAMSGFTDVSSLSMSSIGIKAASMDTSGKLILDEKKFKEQLFENSDEIVNLFTASASGADSDAKSGIALQLQSILRSNVGVSGTKGILIDEAGMAGGYTEDKNYISERIEDYEDKMDELKVDLKNERERYWNKFTALEQALNNLNAQSSWLTDMMG
ncbi:MULTISPECIES: flagellar filament capping protein FliD [unclassified Sedimentibacter]|uniref:flagellar filament capping protein FliD n=1 Tax=unclassified Sedimentibacter TaxID=2649220 RepID=UPI0027E120E8|nr:flagellar filament capping protein FliD [Sedimentibacter sp. MB35-C1]WMJ78631.1 flagellar filament capping protein FliD [Sedimentibacter sp. MB35-C1]